ncbi:hypothetical protein KGF56_000622 [Candida oxycetoniae]|uniref:Uncharacterized protein n=1 Tax=Candida oxycetoniae TaxID=497107 RepID=A0AAI9X024_9ASCO|nr:uncharacterized protein KGF56_000622 [Candida oxycetoniae]KAI3406490.2 hypothetical protein KGF56_000622 [Candida oxycetoniae]
MLEESRLFKFVCVEKISTTFNLRKVAVLQYLISNQIYKIGLDHLKRLGDVPMSYTYYESVFFYLSLLEKSSFRNFHRRRKFLQHWGRLLRQNVVPELRKKIYGTQPPCSDYETRRNFFGMSFSFLLNRLKTFAVSGSGCEEEYDILKFYNGKKTQDFIVLAVILSICGREWDSLAKELGIGRNSRNSSTPILVMNIAVTENFVLTIGKEAVSVIDGTYSPDILKVVHEASRLNNLQVMLSTKSVGILNLDIQRLSRLPSIKASQSWYTEVNFTRKVRRYPEQSPEFGKKFRNIFIKVLQVYDSDLHSIVLREVCSEKEQLVVEEEETEGTEGGELFGTVVNTRTCPGIVTRKIEDDYYMVYNVNGEYEQPARRSLAPWVAKNGQELCSLITLLGLDRLFVLGFRMLIIDRNNRLVKFSKS